MQTIKTLKDLFAGRTPGQLIIQLTDRCNARCPQCAMRVTENFQRSRLSLDHCKEIVDRAAERGVQALSVTGGEPLLFCNDLVDILSHAARAGIKYSRTGSNGFVFRNPEAADFTDRVKKLVAHLASSPVRNFWISIDSSDAQTHESMRGFPGVIKGIEKALPIFHESGLYPTANMGLNRNLAGSQLNSLNSKYARTAEHREEFQDAVAQGLRNFFHFIKNMGFTIVNFCYPMSIEDQTNLEAVYPASSPDYIVSLSPLEKGWLFETLLQTIPKYRHSLRIFSPLSALDTLCKHYQNKSITPFPCGGGMDYLYINSSNGHAYPCGYRGMDDFGDYRQRVPAIKKDAICTRCDWECFRDPSEFFGPILFGLSKPLSLLTTYKRDRDFYRLWFKDHFYYRACDYFNGRKDMDQRKIEKFGSNRTTPPQSPQPGELPTSGQQL